MKFAIIADIHANLEAFQVVLEDIQQQKCTHYACLGDVVGYGPEPRECIDLVKKSCTLCVVGNHDLGAIGKLEMSFFNPAAAEACLKSP